MSRTTTQPDHRLRARLQDTSRPPLLLDGALGTELERRGVPTGLPLWSSHALLDAPDAVLEIHREYLAAGAEALTANTFRTQRRTLSRGGRGERAAELTRLAVVLARRASNESENPVVVLGSAPPLEDCYRPDLVPDSSLLAHEHREHINNLVSAGADAILIETMNSSREAIAALEATQDLGAEALVSFVCDESARLLSGEPLEGVLAKITEFQPSAVLVNCLPPSAVSACLPPLRSSGLPFGVYANLGAPQEATERAENLSPAEFAVETGKWVQAGARIVGGCCGTTPAHIASVAISLEMLAERPTLET